MVEPQPLVVSGHFSFAVSFEQIVESKLPRAEGAPVIKNVFVDAVDPGKALYL